MSGTAIPVLRSGNQPTDKFAEAAKTNLDRLTGQGKNFPRIKLLPVGATDEEMRIKINEVIERMQGK